MTRVVNKRLLIAYLPPSDDIGWPMIALAKVDAARLLAPEAKSDISCRRRDISYTASGLSP